MMKMNLAARRADTTVFDGEGGAYYAWTSTKSPALAQGKLGAGKLVLRPRGFALPHSSDSSKIGYVVQGICTVGLLSPNSPQEAILTIKKGDAIPVNSGTISWRYNAQDSDFIIIFLAETSLSYNPGQIDYFLLTGAIGFLKGFSSEFISKIYGMTEEQSQKLVNSQTSPLIVKLDDKINMPKNESNDNTEKFVFNLESALEITADNFPVLEKVGLSANLVRIEPNNVFGPSFSTDGSYRIIYIIKGSGRVQIVGLGGKRILDAKVQQDQLFVVPKYFAVAQVADEQGMELFSVTTSPRPVLGQLGTGDLSTWKALSSPVLQAALNVDYQFIEFFNQRLQKTTTIFRS